MFYRRGNFPNYDLRNPAFCRPARGSLKTPEFSPTNQLHRALHRRHNHRLDMSIKTDRMCLMTSIVWLLRTAISQIR